MVNAGYIAKKIKQSLPSLAVMMVLVALWWIVVAQTESAIFPTPWQVVTGTLELADDGSLWDHIGASLFRVGAGCHTRRLRNPAPFP